MKRVWRTFRFVQHVRNAIKVSDSQRIKNCDREHVSKNFSLGGYPPELEKRHGRKKRKGRLGHFLHGTESNVEPPSAEWEEMARDYCAAAVAEGYIREHNATEHGDLLCITPDKGARLLGFPLGVAEAILDQYPRTIAVLVSAVIGSAVTLGLVLFTDWLL